ncbi:MAG: hypothetical protein V8T10_03575, partial [Merdibacter sp.]
MRKVQTDDVHAGVDQLAHHFLALGSRSDRTDDFRFSLHIHKLTFFLFLNPFYHVCGALRRIV